MGLPQGEKCGYLQVKVPAKGRSKGRRAWKAWKRKWVVVHGMTVQATKDPVVTIDMYSNESHYGQLERCTVYLERVSDIRRTTSRSHVFAFTVDSDQPLIHLAGRSETDSQAWIYALRRILWPPTVKPPMEGGLGSVFEVSVIESLSSPRPAAQLPGTVGYIMLLPSVMLITSLASGSILMEWPWPMLQGTSLINTYVEEDKGKVILIRIRSEGLSEGMYYFYSEKAANIYEMLVSKIDHYQTESEAVMLRHPPRVLPMNQPLYYSNNGPPRKRSVDKQRKQTKQQQLANTNNCSCSNSSSCCSNSSCEEDRRTAVYTKSQSLLSIAHQTPTAEEEEPIIQVQLRHKNPVNTQMVGLSYENIASSHSPPINALGQGIKSSSDSNLLNEEQSADKMLSNLIRKAAMDSKNQLHSREQQPRLEVSDEKRPTSVHSSVSQMSRDSGVMMTAADETSSAKETDKLRQSPTEEMLVKQFYRPFAEFVDEKTLRLSSCSKRSSTASSNGTIYSEIEQDNSRLGDDMDPMYEDLDKFRQNIHQLLGIKLEGKSDKHKSLAPPPLPPRQYEKGRPVTPVVPVQLHRKDVLKYLGVEDEKKKRYGSLNRQPQAGNKKGGNWQKKRKDIHSYLGISPSSSTSSLVNSSHSSLVELTYDRPKPSFDPLQANEDNRRISRTYIRVRKPEEIPAPPTPKVVKKSKLLKFPKWRRPSSVMKESERPQTTYKSFENVVPEDVSVEQASNSTAEIVEESIAVEQPPLSPLEEAPIVLLEVSNDQYSVPRTRKSNIIIEQCPVVKVDKPVEAHYANLEEIRASALQESSSKKSSCVVSKERPTPETQNNQLLIEEEQYADMSSSRDRIHSIYLSMNTDMDKYKIKLKQPETEVVQDSLSITTESLNKSTEILNKSTENINESTEILTENVPTEAIETPEDEHLQVEVPIQTNLDEAKPECEEVKVVNDEDVKQADQLTNSEEEKSSTSETSTKEIETQTSVMSDFDPEVIKKLIFECNPQGERLRQRLSSYIDQIFSESLMEYDSRRSSTNSNSTPSV